MKKLKAYRPANHTKTSERITMSVPMSREQFKRWARDLEKKWQEEIKANPMAAAPLLKAYEEFKVFTAIRYPDCRVIFDVGDGKRIDWDFFIEKIMEWKGITREEAEGKTLREWRWEQNRDLQDELHRRKAFEEGLLRG